LGDILEQGSLEAEEHRGLAELIAQSDADRVVLLGPRVREHTLPKLEALKPKLPITAFERPDEVLEFLQANLKGGEAILFKGGRFLEGVIEQLLANPKDEKYLVRREPVWVKRRKQWGLPR
jgi:UDP-N-acetylmuramyl pentapeptide synthase